MIIFFKPLLRCFLIKLFYDIEKKWVTTSPYFRMETSRIGMCAVDTFSIAFFYNLFSKVNFNHGRQEDYWNTRRLGGVLSRQILHLACAISGRRSLLGSRSANVNTTLVSRAMKIKSADEEKRQQLIIDNKNNTEAQQGSRGVATRAGSILRKRKKTNEVIDSLIDSSSSDEEEDVDPLLAFKYKRMTKRRLVINQKCDSEKTQLSQNGRFDEELKHKGSRYYKFVKATRCGCGFYIY